MDCQLNDMTYDLPSRNFFPFQLTEMSKLRVLLKCLYLYF